MISAGVDGRLPYMTYPEPWRGPPKQPPAEFLRPAPKPLPNNRYNGMITSSPNGTRLAPPQRPITTKYAPQQSIITPVNLTQHKEEPLDDLQQFNAYARLFPHNAHFTHFAPYSTLYPHYAHTMMRQANFPPTPLSPLETFSPTTPTGTTSSTFLSPSYSPPSVLKPTQTIVREKRTPPHTHTSQTPSPNQGSFKVPCGKEGSLKHRILVRPEDVPRSTNSGPLDLQKPLEVSRKRLLASMSPPRSPKRHHNSNTMNNIGFSAGSLIQLASGGLKKVEEMKTEDFICSADNNPELRLEESTVVKIDENKTNGNINVTLSYNQRRMQVTVESTMEHPYFIYGQGWASYSPEKTFQCYGLKVNRLQVGDILVSLTPREHKYQPERSSTVLTTTVMSASHPQVSSTVSNSSNQLESQPQTQPLNLHNSNQPHRTLSPDSLAARKRRWSAPDEISEEEINNRRHRVE
ncbi:rho GTPase-activating protein gacJ [Harmonia axyridis]|uniref:rho GTPase-activating protein gacJ n=1 Tax=Harmonia axyridis TaxID=115357 RepID=UPI001E277B41|nr:rho GTPase-activating protein gacJ [Harmonia axyridis]XP_045464540.1 rho GTPase-activating protein gacJ [Harmonia axyridis]XP_045464541.1 rho GTPase-activating protein gacJ [Harmonia axyridis]XP_045464542.1 rho GTPase-activating protein gacJ [Harmonia axyridis]